MSKLHRNWPAGADCRIRLTSRVCSIKPWNANGRWARARGLRIRRDESGHLPPDASLFEIVADFERRRIIDQLETSDWSQTAAAEALRIPLSTLNQKIKRLNIEIRKKSGA